MTYLIATRPRRIAWSLLAFVFAAGTAVVLSWMAASGANQIFTDGEIMKRFLAMPALIAFATLALLSACAQNPAAAVVTLPAPVSDATTTPFIAQVVGVQWLNPLQRRDYPTEWQLLWTMGLAGPNQNDDMVRTDPKMFSKLQAIGGLAAGNGGSETFRGFHKKYVSKLINLSHDIYFSSSRYF